jgi:hypothetical protein
VEFGVAKIHANISRTGTGTEVTAIVEEIPGHIGMLIDVEILQLTSVMRQIVTFQRLFTAAAMTSKLLLLCKLMLHRR